MAIVDDFKDIASRMKGELAPKREPLTPDYDAGDRPMCGACCGYGENPPNSVCSLCAGKGHL